MMNQKHQLVKSSWKPSINQIVIDLITNEKLIVTHVYENAFELVCQNSKNDLKVYRKYELEWEPTAEQLKELIDTIMEHRLVWAKDSVIYCLNSSQPVNIIVATFQDITIEVLYQILDKIIEMSMIHAAIGELYQNYVKELVE